jgi:protein O-GlcNAc transferase
MKGAYGCQKAPCKMTSIKQPPLSQSQAFGQALALHQQGQFAEAEHLCLLVLRAAPDHFDARHVLALLRFRAGRYAEALEMIRAVVKAQPHSADAWSNLGLILRGLHRREEALNSFGKALVINPDHAVTLYNRGVILNELDRREEAIASYDRALTIKPDLAEALYHRGNALRDLARLEEAIASYDKALTLNPYYIETHNSRGNVLLALRRPEEAIASFERALTIRPDHAEALFNRGNALHELKRLEEAVVSYDKALAVRQDYAEALYNRGNTLFELERHEEALASYDKALPTRPDHIPTLNNRGNALQKIGRHEEALASYDQALAIKQDDANALYNRGNALLELERHREALASYGKAARIEPDHPYALGALANCALAMCDWTLAAELRDRLEAHIIAGKSIINPFTVLGYFDSPALQLQCAKTFIRSKIPQLPPPFWTGQVWRHDKIRIAYLSADFRQHATAFLTVDLFGLHDRSRFEVLGISYGRDDKSETRTRLVEAFDQFHDVASKTDRAVARLLHDLEVDIVIDLKGITYGARPAILAYRGAPIQVNYLGYPGTMGTNFVDYIVADRIVLPFDQQSHFPERIVHLPDCYQVNSKRKMAVATPTRRDAGLPENGFVFCCFNNNYKITAPMFDVWIRLLAAVDGSVLWLLRDNASAEANLREEARLRGVDPSRLVFAARVTVEEHLARHRLADLFLDTLPFNAHTTASDALWTGLPVLTSSGCAFAGRVAASLLGAVGLPELVTLSLNDYEALGLRLASEPSLLTGFRHTLRQEGSAHALFDTRRFCRHLEAAFMTMWELWQCGESPRSFAVWRSAVNDDIRAGAAFPS